MKIKFLSAMALCALLASCGGNASSSGKEANGKGDSAIAQAQAPAAEVMSENKTDWARDFMKALDKKYLPKEIVQADLDEAFSSDYREDEETGEFFPSFSVLHSNGDGCTDCATAYAFQKKDGKSCFVLLVLEAGCDGSSSVGIKAFSFDGLQITETQNPIERPAIEEMTKGIADPSLADLKKDYYYCEDLMAGLDVRLENGSIAIRPGQLGYDNLYDLYTPVTYSFNGETLVKK